tara:strand:+ start:66 stop:215 length:150 start_codon:yes stop_codon:yes gene_type:complete
MSVIIYQDHIDILEEQNSVLKKEVRILRALLRKEKRDIISPTERGLSST